MYYKLSAVWENRIRDRRLMLVLTGSAVSIMERMLGAQGGLHRRAALECRLDPFTVREADVRWAGLDQNGGSSGGGPRSSSGDRSTGRSGTAERGLARSVAKTHWDPSRGSERNPPSPRISSRARLTSPCLKTQPNRSSCC